MLCLTLSLSLSFGGNNQNACIFAIYFNSCNSYFERSKGPDEKPFKSNSKKRWKRCLCTLRFKRIGKARKPLQFFASFSNLMFYFLFCFTLFFGLMFASPSPFLFVSRDKEVTACFLNCSQLLPIAKCIMQLLSTAHNRPQLFTTASNLFLPIPIVHKLTPTCSQPLLTAYNCFELLTTANC